MLEELDDLYVSTPLHLVPNNEAVVGKPAEHGVGLLLGHASAIREQFGADTERSIFQASLPVSHAPETLEQLPVERVSRTKDFILEESRFEATRANSSSP
jgi:hypothetical protein